MAVLKVILTEGKQPASTRRGELFLLDKSTPHDGLIGQLVILVEFEAQLDGIVALLFTHQHLAAEIGGSIIALAIVFGGELVPQVNPGAQLLATLRTLDVQVQGAVGARGRGGENFAEAIKDGHEDILT